MHQEKVQQEKIKAVKARLKFEEVSQHSELGTPSRRKDLSKRLESKHICSIFGSLRPRRGRSESPRKRDPERKTMFKRLEKGVFHKLGDKEKSMSAYSNNSRHQSYHSSRRDTKSCETRRRVCPYSLSQSQLSAPSPSTATTAVAEILNALTRVPAQEEQFFNSAHALRNIHKKEHPHAGQKLLSERLKTGMRILERPPGPTDPALLTLPLVPSVTPHPTTLPSSPAAANLDSSRASGALPTWCPDLFNSTLTGSDRQKKYIKDPWKSTISNREKGSTEERLPSSLHEDFVRRVLVIKPPNKTPYELILGRKPALSFMRPFGCPVTILNTLDHLGKFDGKADKGFFVGYSTNIKAYRVFNSRTRILEENLHVRFSEETPNIAGNEPNWRYDIDALTISMNYKLVVARIQTNGNAGTKENIDAGQDGKNIVPDQKYILLPLLTSDPLLSKSSKDSPDAGFKPSREEEKIDSEHQENEDSEVPNIQELRVNQEKDANVNNTNNINTVNPTVSTADIDNNVVDENIVYGCIDDPNMPNLEEIVYSYDDEEVGADADMNNLATNVPVSPIPTTRVHKDHPLKQITGDIHSAPHNRRMTKNVTEHVEPKKVIQALTDPIWIEAMQDELLQFKLQKVYRNKKDDRGIMVRNKARLVAQGYTQEEGIDYDKVFAPVARIEEIGLFLAYASFMGFNVYQMDVKSAFFIWYY
ncbi:ribonuclease H-like domain-containing protein [Tanacetum coccineum]